MLLFSYNTRRFEKKLMGAVWAHVKLMVTQNSLTTKGVDPGVL